MFRLLIGSTLSLGIVLLFGCQTPDEHQEENIKLLNIRIIHTSCIVDQPLGIKRYSIAATHVGGFGEGTIKNCQEKFKSGVVSPKTEISAAFSSHIEYQVSVTFRDEISCLAFKAGGISTPLFLITVLDLEDMNKENITECLSTLNNELERLSRLPPQRIDPPDPQPKFHTT